MLPGCGYSKGLMSLVIFSLMLFLLASPAAAGQTFRIDKASKTYTLEVKITRCEDDQSEGRCAGPATIGIYRKNEKAPFQQLSLRRIEVGREQLAYNPELNKKPRKVYDDEYSFIFGDFNFDGNEDFAVCNGREGGYGAPSYNVYIFNATTGKFAENRSLSRLTIGYLGLFFVEPKTKQLVALSKSGCCYHETQKYRIVNDRPVLVEKIIEDAGGPEDFVVVTTKRLVNGRWIKSVKKEKMKPEK
jgi:hypothetical protein